MHPSTTSTSSTQGAGPPNDGQVAGYYSSGGNDCSACSCDGGSGGDDRAGYYDERFGNCPPIGSRISRVLSPLGSGSFTDRFEGALPYPAGINAGGILRNKCWGIISAAGALGERTVAVAAASECERNRYHAY